LCSISSAAVRYRAASLIDLVPRAVAVEAAIAFGEPLTVPFAIGPFVVVADV
jgi:hypothetical protein